MDCSAFCNSINNYQALVSAFQVIQQDHDEYAAKASGLMDSFGTFNLKLSHLIFSSAEQFSINLSAKDSSVGEGVKGAHLLRSHSSLRNEKCNTFYDDNVNSSERLTDDPILPRYRRVPGADPGGVMGGS
jgi:hypothetical protein